MANDYFNYDAFKKPPEAPVLSSIWANGAKGAVSGGAAGAATGNPYVAAGLAAIGAATNIYQGLKGNESTEKNYQSQLQAYDDSLEAQKKENERMLEAQRLANLYTAAQYSDQLQQGTMKDYAPFYASVAQ
jgi:hypothetical protein